MPWVALAASLLSRIGMGGRLLLATFPPSAEPSPVDRAVRVFGLRGPLGEPAENRNTLNIGQGLVVRAPLLQFAGQGGHNIGRLDTLSATQPLPSFPIFGLVRGRSTDPAGPDNTQPDRQGPVLRSRLKRPRLQNPFLRRGGRTPSQTKAFPGHFAALTVFADLLAETQSGD